MDFTLLDFGISDHLIYERLTREFEDSSPIVQVQSTFRHDGSSPLPLGMDWSSPPQKWDGRHTVWPHDPPTGWSYCITIPSWTTLSDPRGSGPVVYYRVQVGIQTPEAITSTRGILRRFSDFLKLFSELQKLFPKKSLPAPPPRKLMGAQSRSLIEERRSSLEGWMDKLLLNIDVSRSAPVAIFLELEAAARSSFNDSSADGVSSVAEYQPNSKVSMTGSVSSVASDYGDSTSYNKSDIETPGHGGHAGVNEEKSASDIDLTGGAETAGASVKYNRANSDRKDKSYEDTFGNASRDEYGNEILSEGEDKVMGHLTSFMSTDSTGSDLTSLKASDWGTSRFHDEGGPNSPVGADGPIDDDLQSPSNLLVALPSDQRHKISRVFVTMQRRLATAKADMEDLVARLNQELAVRQYLTTRLTDLEVDLETTKESTKDNIQQAFSAEKEKYTQMQWDMEELRKKCLEMEMKLKAEQDEKMCLASENSAIIQENELLKQRLDVARDQLESSQKHHDESETKSKTDLKVLVKEVKSLRSSQSDLKEELSNLTKEKLELERDLQNEKQKSVYASSVNEKLLHECSILQKRLEESSVNFLVEEEDKLVLDTSPSDAIDLLTTSDNRIGLLLAEAQLLAQDVEYSADRSNSTTVDELRKMVTELFVDNATRRKQINSLIHCALKTLDLSDEGKEVPSKQTVLGKFL
ncbi:PX domain-containing protein EREX-like isoform X2 [Chenopodium quinoa]|uniref:PX domain-containing protein EREX-like isoform X2 n=1 Tax=Chenopodium quinoa TaxID=63459 RepID=UPI000B7807AB|nr:PX domain-containing protein EREX-like isoform X2 [Chenopodium quinoa]